MNSIKLICDNFDSMPGNVKEDLLLYGDSRFNENENYIMEATINYIKSTERSLFIVSLPSNVQILTYNSDLSDISIFHGNYC